MNKIVLLYQQDKEQGEFFSLTMLKYALETKGVFVEEKTLADVNTIRDSVVFLIKFLNPTVGQVLKSNNNYIVMDLVDVLAHINNQNGYVNHLVNDSKVDKFLVRQQWVAETFGAQFATYIPFHYDYRLDEITPSEVLPDTKKISFPYSDAGNVIMHNKFPELFDTVVIDGKDCFNFDKIAQIHINASKNYFYFSVRSQDSNDYLFKPATKVASAAAMSRNIITSYDECVRDLLPVDYPYIFTGNSPDEFFQFYEEKIKFPNREAYTYGLQCMKAVRQKTNIFNQVELYERLFTRGHNG